MRPTLSLSLTLALFATLACACPGTTGTTGTSGSGGSTGKGTTGGRTSGSNGGSTTGGSLGNTIGHSCNPPKDPCNTGLTCITEITGGYCSVACDPTNGSSCPVNATCVEVLQQFACGLSCATNADCTRTGYACDPLCGVCIPGEFVGQLACGANIPGAGGHAGDGGPCGALPSAAGTLTWSPSISVSASASTFNESEGSGAVTADGGIIVLGYMEGADGGVVSNLIGVSASYDDGKTFTVEPAFSGTGDAIAYDPSVAVDSSGLFYYSWGGAYTSPNGQGGGDVWVTTSRDGADWSMARSILDAGDIAAGGGGIDKPFLGVNPYESLPYVVMGTFKGLYGGTGPYQIRLIVGNAGGTTWQASVEVDDSPFTQRGAGRDLPSLAFDLAGNAYVAWAETQDPTQIAEDQVTGNAISGSSASSIWFSEVQTPLGGVPLPGEPNVKVSATADNVVFDVPKIVAAPNALELYVAYTVSTGTNNVTNIEVATSSTLGSTWNPPVVVNDALSDAATCSTNFHPAAFLDSTNNFWVTWIGNLDGQGHVFYSESKDQGATFSPPALVSDVSFAFNSQLAIPATMGGYQSLFGINGQIISLWTGAPSSTNPSAPAHVFLQEAPLP